VKQTRVLIALLALLTIASLAISAKYLYTTPFPNSWIFWSGDETQAMQEERAQIEHGIYQYPSAYGSIYSKHSGVLKGSVWITSVVYGGAAILTGLNPVEVGRSVSFILGLVLLGAMFAIARYFRVSASLAMFGVFLLASSICLFMNSHSARYDVLVSLTAILTLAGLIRYLTNTSHTNARKALIAGVITGGLLTVSLHLVMGLTVSIVFLMIYFGVFRSVRSVAAFLLPIAGWIAILSLIFYLRSGELSLMGPFRPGLFPLPIKNVLHPRSHLGNLGFRLFVARYWSHAVLVLLIPTVLIGAYALRRHWAFPRVYVAWFVATVLFTLSVFYTEQIVPRYHIYYLPAIIISMVLVLSVWNKHIESSWKKALLNVCVIGFSVWSFYDYTSYALVLGDIGKTLTTANASAMDRAFTHLDTNRQTLVEAPAQYIVGSRLKEHFVSPFIVSDPLDSTVPLADRFARNDIRQAVIVSSQRVPLDDRYYEASRNYWQSHAELVYLETGQFTDIGRTYGADGMTGVDSVKVYRIP
jgi:hypothetical protein